jgi:FkbM family methyltransferase
MKKYTYYLQSIFELITGIRNWPLVVRTFLNQDTSPKKLIFLRQSGLTFAVRGKMDIWSVKEAFIDRFYEKYGCQIGEEWTVMDIGAGLGEFTLFAAASHPSNRVLAFEPFAESFALLQENIAQNHIQNIEAYPLAIWGKSGSLLLDLSGGEPLQLQSSQNAAAAETASDGHHRQVDCSSLSDIFERLNVAQLDLLKLDCEGAEYPILFQTEPRALEKIRRIVMEYHDQIRGNNHRDLEQFLTQRGFRVRVVVNPVHSEIGYLYAER